MSDEACVAFLQWALPRIELDWSGFRKVRRQVCRRVVRRARALGLYELDEYRAHLEAHVDEWKTLASLCTVSISRFYRDRSVFDALAERVLPALAQAACERGASAVSAWSAGCASGEEPYTLALLWHLRLQPRFPDLELEVLGTDIDTVLIERARAACYPPGSLALLPEDLRTAFEARDRLRCLGDPIRRYVEFARQDLCTEMPRRRFDLVLCRNLAFTYFAPARAARTLTHLALRLKPGAALVVGLHERLPATPTRLEPWPECRAIYCSSA